MKYYIIAGEASGDLHGSNLMRAILEKDRDASFQYWGGDHMESIAPKSIMHIRETAIMGFAEVVKNLSKIKSFFKLAKQTLEEYNPDVVILIDYPGFNLRMAKWAKTKGYKTAFYISPQLWAWKKNRKETIRRYVDELLVILPFEKEFYKNEDIEAHYVGHPLLEAIETYNYDETWVAENNIDKPIIALLPGSRKQEVTKMLPIMYTAAKQYQHKYQIVVAGTDHMEVSSYKSLVSDDNEVIIATNKTYDVLRKSKLALVTSGTATLETALHNVPLVVCYKTSQVNYRIGKWLVDLPYISLVNLIMGEKLVTELIQQDFNKENLHLAINSILENETNLSTLFYSLREKLSTSKTASKKSAKRIIKLAKK